MAQTFLTGLAQGLGGESIQSMAGKKRRMSREKSDDLIEQMKYNNMIYEEKDQNNAGTGRWLINAEEFHKASNKDIRKQFINHERGAKKLFEYYETEGFLGKRSSGKMKPKVKQGYYEDTITMPDGSKVISTKQEDEKTDGQVTFGRDTDPDAEVVVFDKGQYEDILQSTLDRHMTWAKPGVGSSRERLKIGKEAYQDRRELADIQNEYYDILQTALSDEKLTPDERALLLESRPAPETAPEKDPTAGADVTGGAQPSTTSGMDKPAGPSADTWEKNPQYALEASAIENNRIKAEKASNWWKGKQAEVDKRNYKTINSRLDTVNKNYENWRSQGGKLDKKASNGEELDRLQQKIDSNQELTRSEEYKYKGLKRRHDSYMKSQKRLLEQKDAYEAKYEPKVKDPTTGENTEIPTTDSLESKLDKNDPVWTNKELQSIQKLRAQEVLTKYGVNSINELVSNKQMDMAEKRLAMQEVSRQIALSEFQALGTTVDAAAKSYLTTMHNAAMSGDPNINMDQFADNLAAIERNALLAENQRAQWNEKIRNGGKAGEHYGKFIAELWDEEKMAFKEGSNFRKNAELKKHFSNLHNQYRTVKRMRLDAAKTGQPLDRATQLINAETEKMYLESLAYLALAEGARRTDNFGQGRFMDGLLPNWLGGMDELHDEGIFGGVLGSMRIQPDGNDGIEYLTWVINKQGVPAEERISLYELNKLTTGASKDLVDFLKAGGSLREL